MTTPCKTCGGMGTVFRRNPHAPQFVDGTGLDPCPDCERYPSVTAHDHRKRRYRYCDECADDVVFAIEGAEVLP